MYLNACSLYSALGCLLAARLQGGRELVSLFVVLLPSEGVRQIPNKKLA